jgi:thymidylate kinase
MIIELFGAPGSGKTTFARALAARLREHGQRADLVISYRPAERLPNGDSRAGSQPPHQSAAVVSRVTRPLVEMLTLARHPVVNSHSVATALNLIRLVPPKKMIWSIRLSQYISRLSHSWNQARKVGHVVLFDQAYIQAICSLATVSLDIDDSLLELALDYVPKPDLVVFLHAPLEILSARLRERHRKQGPIERMLELGVEHTLESKYIIDRVHELVCARGQPIATASSIEAQSLNESVARIERLVLREPAIQVQGFHDECRVQEREHGDA